MALEPFPPLLYAPMTPELSFFLRPLTRIRAARRLGRTALGGADAAAERLACMVGGWDGRVTVVDDVAVDVSVDTFTDVSVGVAVVVVVVRILGEALV